MVEFLANHPQVEKVNHPSLPDHPDHALYQKYFPNGGASIFTFNIKGGREEAFTFIDNLKIFSLLANVADVKSLVIHPASTTHSQLNSGRRLGQELRHRQQYGSRPAWREREFRTRQIHRHHGPVRLRQIHAYAHARRPRLRHFRPYLVRQGADLTRMDDKQLTLLRRHKIGFIFQSFNLLPMFTAEQNILMPLTLAGDKPDHAWFDLLVDTLGLKQRLNHRPNELSGGQQQRVAIARALITKPKLVFADEPTGNLDSVSSAEVLGFLKRSVNELGQTIVMVTHDAVAASYADRAIVFADGQIVADEANPTAETMNDLLMAERERATRAAVTSTRADTLARLAGVKDVPNLPITDAPLPPAGRTGTMRHARAAAQHAR